MSLKRRLISISMVLVLLGLFIVAGLLKLEIPAKEEDSKGLITTKKDTIYFWYTDDSLTDYINSAAVSFGDLNHIRVIPVLKSGTEYLEQINSASLDDSENTPDVYLIGSDSLGMAHLAGLADHISDDNKINTDSYPQSAIDAITYDGCLVAYPYYYVTSAYLYNKTYLENYVKEQIDAEEEAAEEAAAEAASSENNTAETTGTDSTTTASDENSEEAVEEKVYDEELVATKLQAILPTSIQGILDFADEYEAPAEVEYIFKWDVSDVFYNYYFVGNYMTVGGETGDDKDNINIYNNEVIQCLQSYQDLNQFFSIDADTVTYEGVLDEFMEGKIVFSVVINDAVARLEAAKSEGKFDFEYGIMNVPGVSDELGGRSLSVTNVVAVNGYSENIDMANKFAEYLTYDYTQNLYARTGKCPAKYLDEYTDEDLEVFMSEYERSIGLPKMIETGNFWIKLEVLFAKVWNGGDVDSLVQELSSEIISQLNASDAE